MNADRPSDAATGFGALRMLRTLGACVGAIVCLVLLGSLWSLANVPTFFLIALLALIALTVVRPHVGLLMVAIAVPVVSWLCRGWTYSVAWAETVVVAFAAGWFVHDLRAARQADDLDPPIHLVWTIVAASLLVYLTAVAWKLTGNPLSLGLGQVIQRFFGVKASGDGLDAAARLLECVVLFRAASAAAEANSEFTPALMRCLVLGATAAGFLEHPEAVGSGAAIELAAGDLLPLSRHDSRERRVSRSQRGGFVPSSWRCSRPLRLAASGGGG